MIGQNSFTILGKMGKIGKALSHAERGGHGYSVLARSPEAGSEVRGEG